LRSRAHTHYSYYHVTGKNTWYALAGGGDKYIYGKVARTDAMPWLDCRELEYDPRGLYVFARDPREFVEKTLVKMEKYRL